MLTAARVSSFVGFQAAITFTSIAGYRIGIFIASLIIFACLEWHAKRRIERLLNAAYVQGTIDQANELDKHLYKIVTTGFKIDERTNLRP